MSNSIKDSAQAFAVNQVLKYVDSNPQEAFPKLLDWADKFDKDNLYLTQRQQIRKVMEQPDSNWMRLINSLWTDIDSEVRKVFFRNFIVNASLLGSRKQVANREKYGCNIPWAILMDPTSACNLHCTGCWAAEYGNKLNLSYEELEAVVYQQMVKKLASYKTLTGKKKAAKANPKITALQVELAHVDSEIEKLVDSLTGANNVLFSYVNVKIAELDGRKQELLARIAELTVEAISPEQVSQISGYLDTWENVSFDDKRRVVDLMITTIAATSDSLNITWKI